MSIKLVEFELLDLYGLYNHRLKFKEGENVSILHGPNGVGKTALLRSISFLFGSKFNELGRIPFGSLRAKLSDQTEILVTRVGVSKEQLLKHSKETQKITIEISRGKVSVASATFNERHVRSDFLLPPWVIRLEDGQFYDTDSQELLPEWVASPTSGRSVSKNRKSLEAVKVYLNQIKVHFVETNRLYKQVVGGPRRGKEGPRFSSTVKECAKHLVLLIGTALKDYGAKSQELDQSFPHRFISEPAVPMSLDDLKSRLHDLALKLRKLREIGLLDADGIHPFDTESLDRVGDNKLEIMNLYVRDSEDKLAVFDDISSRVQVLLESLNNKFNNKNIKLSKEAGLVVEGFDSVDLQLEDLSSGEQHEIVLLYELLFKVESTTLVLIDEPELSLHMSWQKAFLPELISISREVGFSSILATHSPFIVGGRDDLMVSLNADADDDFLE